MRCFRINECTRRSSRAGRAGWTGWACWARYTSRPCRACCPSFTGRTCCAGRSCWTRRASRTTCGSGCSRWAGRAGWPSAAILTGCTRCSCCAGCSRWALWSHRSHRPTLTATAARPCRSGCTRWPCRSTPVVCIAIAAKRFNPFVRCPISAATSAELRAMIHIILPFWKFAEIESGSSVYAAFDLIVTCSPLRSCKIPSIIGNRRRVRPIDRRPFIPFRRFCMPPQPIAAHA